MHFILTYTKHLNPMHVYSTFWSYTEQSKVYVAADNCLSFYLNLEHVVGLRKIKKRGGISNLVSPFGREERGTGEE